jgi:hypothetical protein
MTSGAGRSLFAGRDLLDHQIVDSDGFLAGKVDDLELDEPAEPGGLPVVAAILTGPGALAGQFGRRLGPWLASLHVRLHPTMQAGPARVPFLLVKRVEEHVELSVPRDALTSSPAEEWARDAVIGKIPGARRAPD